jgi:hypothetical protein
MSSTTTTTTPVDASRTGQLVVSLHDEVDGERESVQLVLTPDEHYEHIVTIRLAHAGDVLRLPALEAIAFAYMLHDVLLAGGARGLLPHE